MEHISPNLLVIISLLVAAFVGILFSIIQNKSQKIEALFDAFEKLKKSFNDLDEQAKLIVRTDLELNKAQEELDKRLDGLDALQKISRLISTTLVENEIFKRLDQALTTNLKFEKSLILTYTEKGTLSDRVTIGFNQKNIPSLLGTIENNTDILKALREGRPLSSATSSQLRRELLSRVFNTEHFIFSPILSQKGVIGLVFVGAPSSATNITAGDEEIISVLASLIGQTLENAKSFDEVFRSGQILEMKVADRTKQLESALTKVQNINKVKSEFISAVSHELRTPLTSIKGYAAILMAGKLGDIPAQVKKRLEKINSHSDKLVNLINELLDISRIESGRVEMKITSCNLGEIIETVKDLLSPQIKDKNIQWSLANALFTYNLADAKAFEEKLEAEKKAEEEKKNSRGLFIKTLELPGPAKPMFKLLRSWSWAKFLSRFGLPKNIAKQNSQTL